MSPRTKLLIVVVGAVILSCAALTLAHYLVSYSQGIDSYRRAMRKMDAGNLTKRIACKPLE